MWVSFALSFITLLILIYCPGYIFLSGIGMNGAHALVFAPLFSVVAYSSLALLFSAAGIPSSGILLFCVVISISFVFFVASRLFRKFANRRQIASDSSAWAIDINYLALYAMVGTIVVTVFFIKGLDGPASFNQAFDNGFHLSTVRTFLESCDYSPFHTGSYARGSFTPFSVSNSFYPAAWHCLCAMLVSIIGCEITLAFNALSAVCAGVIFPMAMGLFISTLWRGNTKRMRLGAFVAPAFSSFPLSFVTYGPLYPNLLSMCMLPCLLSSFILLTDLTYSSKAARIRFGCIFLLGLLASCFAQPNTVFSAAVILAPYCIYQAGIHVPDILHWKKTARNTAISMIITLGIIVLIWGVCYSLPAFQGVVSFVWPKRFSAFQAIVNIALLSFVQGTVQLLLSLFVAVGLVRQIFMHERRWIAWSYLFACFIFFIAVATDGAFKQFLAGFWYTDPYRLAATAVVVAVPVATLGAEGVLFACKRLCASIRQGQRTELATKVVFALLILSIYIPSFSLDGIAYIETAFGGIYSSVAQQNEISNNGNVLTEDELKFAERALELVPDGARIINQPNDGSAFLYPLYNANLVYRIFALPSLDNELDASATVRQALCDINTDQSVHDAALELGAEYVLLLDAGGERDGRSWLWSYYEDQWAGLNGIKDETPGFEVMLADGDMRLYRIAR